MIVWHVPLFLVDMIVFLKGIKLLKILIFYLIIIVCIREISKLKLCSFILVLYFFFPFFPFLYRILLLSFFNITELYYDQPISSPLPTLKEKKKKKRDNYIKLILEQWKISYLTGIKFSCNELFMTIFHKTSIQLCHDQFQ